MLKFNVKEIRKIIMEACKLYDDVNWYGIALLMNNETEEITYTQIISDNEFTQGEHNGTEVRICNIYNKKKINYLEEARNAYEQYSYAIDNYMTPLAEDDMPL